jgi:hypothetical protein
MQVGMSTHCIDYYEGRVVGMETVKMEEKKKDVMLLVLRMQWWRLS